MDALDVVLGSARLFGLGYWPLPQDELGAAVQREAVRLAQREAVRLVSPVRVP